MIGTSASPSSAPRTTAEIIARTARRLGATDLFEVMGGSNMRVVHAFAEAGAALHHFRHENGAAGAADGYARATGQVGWASVVHGPGFTNAMTALRTAVKARSPLVLIMSDVMATPARNAPFEVGNQGLAPDAILGELGVAVVRVDAPTAAQDTVSAYSAAMRGRTPVALIVPHGSETLPSASDIESALAALPTGPGERHPDPDAVAAAELALREAKQIVILAGRGASDPDTAKHLERLAAVTGAYLATSVKGIGAFEDSPASLGIFGGFTPPEGVRIIGEADCILAVGVSLNFIQTRRSTLLAGSRVVQIDDDPRAFGRYDRADVAVLGDAPLVVRELLARLEAEPILPERALPTAPPRTGSSFTDVSAPHQVDPRALAAELDRLLPHERAAVIDGGHFTVWPIAFMRHPSPESLLWTCDFGATGCGLGPAIGAAVGRPERLTVLYIGDCGLFMSLGDLEVAARERIPLLIVCFNDGAAGSEIVLSEIAGLPAADAIFGVSDLARIASSLGTESAVIATVADLEPALAGWDRSGPLFLDCRITRDVRSPLYAQYT
ncbi:MAG: Acetolactate synthase isozyme 3 large subunit [Naasia sp.]|nr:Acetolactate synthase isozyme 3 large subunit [Naasia sp.]